MKTKKAQSAARLGAIVLGAILASCSTGRIGYGVVLWSNNTTMLEDGQVVSIRAESKINDTYAIPVNNIKTPVEIPTWRVMIFKSQKEAQSFSEAYRPYVPLFGHASVNGAAIHQKPENSSDRVYRMREGQTIKIISKVEQGETIDGVSGHWYHVLTDDGTLGYVFDADISIVNSPTQSAADGSGATKQLGDILSTTFRPQYFRQMIDSHHIDLSRFSTDYGFSVDRSAKTVRIVMPEYALSFQYSDVKDLGNDQYVFDGTPVQLTVHSPDEIRLQYTDAKNNQYDEVFVRIPEDIGLLVDQEKSRRQQIYGTFLDKQPFASDYYGKIVLDDSMHFTWTGFNRLVPGIIPAGTVQTGRVGFPLYLDESLQGQYDGTITFDFGAAGDAPIAVAAQSSAAGTGGNGNVAPPQPGTIVSFLYSFTSSGVRLTYVPQNTVSDTIVTRISSTPIIVFFSFGTR